ncbi:sensor histidine kinase [Nonlabens xiamenensis]|uniref:sensor histidine kinase n=1 Tax=Nonlabens xiamenensis TaxID=2341043 RepID=UPI000F61364A|nr:PAS domain-containing sensor histidine kinase [Nonlabens xiamenensis]
MRISPKKSLQQQLEDKDYFLKETALITETGSYSANLETGYCFMDDIGRGVLGLPQDYAFNMGTALDLFADQSDAAFKFQNCLKGFSFEEDLQLVTYQGKKIWVKATGKPLKSETGEIIGIRGVFTSIDRFISQGKELVAHAKVIEAQNERLVHFAHIVSHNLRSHASNLELTLETFADSSNQQEQEVFRSYLDDISKSLTQTLAHLNEVVTINTQKKTTELINFQEILDQVLATHQPLIDSTQAKINVDFSALSEAEYIPHFMASIMSNMVSNAIKYKSPERQLVLNIRTKVKKGKLLMIFEDNGIGIDMKKHGAQLFHMYRTFHDNSDGKGVGLFLTKNQVESLGGDISVSSVLGKGSCFTVKL